MLCRSLFLLNLGKSIRLLIAKSISMRPNDSAGRIHKVAFLVNWTLLEQFYRPSFTAELALGCMYNPLCYFSSIHHRQNRPSPPLSTTPIYWRCLTVLCGSLPLCCDGLPVYHCRTIVRCGTLIITPASVKMPLDFLNQILHFHRISDAFVILSYTALYAVKFSLLFLFRTLVRRIPNMVIFWRVVVAITGVAWVVSSISAWLPCLYYDIRSCKFFLQFIS